MKFYIANEQLDAQIREIKQKIRLSMNGVTADSMKEKGVFYKQNFGVELPVLRQIAQLYEPSADLAERLWLIGGRETMILSVFLEPVDKLTVQKAVERVKSSQQKEIIDVLCLYLFRKTTFATDLAIKLVSSENTDCRIAGFMLASRIYTQLSADEVKFLIKKSEELSASDNFRLYKSIGICLGRLCRLNIETLNVIEGIVENFCTSGTPPQCAIADEVKQEIDFLKNL